MDGRSDDWRSRGKTVAGLIRELQSFEDQGLEVRLSLDGGSTSVALSQVAKVDGRCQLMNCEEPAAAERHPAQDGDSPGR